MAHRVTGRALWLNVHKGYSFVHCDDKDYDIFFHHSDIAKKPK